MNRDTDVACVGGNVGDIDCSIWNTLIRDY